MPRPRLLDLFCGAGGAAMGYHRAGFDVVGVDIEPQPRYAFLFVQMDAFRLMDRALAGKTVYTVTGVVPGQLREYHLSDFAAIHASPPCYDHIRTRPGLRDHGTAWMLAAARERLLGQSAPWVIENVPGAAMRADYKLCGCMFGLDIRRERWFETSWHGFALDPPHDHSRPAVTIYGHGGSRSHMRARRGAYVPIAESRAAMGIPWMNTDELSQAIPPAYTEYIGRQLLDHLKAVA